MRLINLSEARSDLTLAKSLYTPDGKLLLGAGTRLLPNFVRKLALFGITSIYIVDEATGTQEVEDIITERTRLEARLIVRETLVKVDVTNRIDAQKVKKIINDIISEILSNRNLLMQLADLRSIHDKEYTFAHSVNVSVLSILTGLGLGYSQTDLHEIGIGAILHDIGKSLVEDKILNKPGNLTPQEYSLIQTHTTLGFEVLTNQPQISYTSALIALQHHEKFNGEGYPVGLSRKGIHEFSRIVAISDVYDALTSDRVYRRKFLPHEAAEYIQSQGNYAFDPYLVGKFLENVAIYPIGTVVILNNGLSGVVIGTPKGFPTRPVVRIFDSIGSYVQEINLVDNPTVFITDTIDESSTDEPLIESI